MEEIIVNGLTILCTPKNMQIKNSYQIQNTEQMKNILIEALAKTQVYYTKRELSSLINEWVTHNRLYKLHLFRSHTAHCDLESEIKPWKDTTYCVCSK